MMTDLVVGGLFAVAVGISFLQLLAHTDPRRTRDVLLEILDAQCPNCSTPVSYKALAKGMDCSPWEEHWRDAVASAPTDEMNGDAECLQHCQQTCRRLQCDHCGQVFVIRLNEHGEQFGPRLSTETAD